LIVSGQWVSSRADEGQSRALSRADPAHFLSNASG